MFAFQKKKHLLILSLFTVIVSACGSSTQSQADISTAVAQTVVAQDSLTEVASLPTSTTAPSIKTTVLPDVLGTKTPAPVVGAPGCAVSARLAGETPPDQTLLKPANISGKPGHLKIPAPAPGIPPIS